MSEDTELLTDAEHKAMELTAQLVNAMAGIIGDGSGAHVDDFREVVIHIHALQNMVLAQAAARAYPGTYRLLGNVS